MAKPRIFLSSTFYDLRQIRADLDRFIKDLGYEPVLNEMGNIPYGKEERLEEYCYKEINSIDILIAIIGGRFGSSSSTHPYSISQMEIKNALDLNKQVYIFIDKNVNAEYQTFLFNKENLAIKYRYVDNIKIYEFIEKIDSLPNNNTIQPFETSNDIISFLKEQWAGLFKRFLEEQTRTKEINLIKGIENTARTLNKLVNYLTDEGKDKDQAIKDILLSNHPAMEQLKNILGVPYKTYFSNIEELDQFMYGHGYEKNYMQLTFDEFYEYLGKFENVEKEIKISISAFHDDGKLKIFNKEEWNEDFISIHSKEIFIDIDDDLPF